MRRGLTITSSIISPEIVSLYVGVSGSFEFTVTVFETLPTNFPGLNFTSISPDSLLSNLSFDTRAAVHPQEVLTLFIINSLSLRFGI